LHAFKQAEKKKMVMEETLNKTRVVLQMKAKALS